MRNGTIRSTPSTRVSAAKKPKDSGEPPRARAHVIERRDGQHEEERFGVDGREEDRGRKDRNVKDRAPRDRAVVFVLEQLVEIEQAEEERGVRDEQAGNEMIARERSDDSYQQRIEREERHVGALIALGRNVEVVNGVPAAPDGEQERATILARASRRAGR